MMSFISKHRKLLIVVLMVIIIDQLFFVVRIGDFESITEVTSGGLAGIYEAYTVYKTDNGYFYSISKGFGDDNKEEYEISKDEYSAFANIRYSRRPLKLLINMIEILLSQYMSDSFYYGTYIEYKDGSVTSMDYHIGSVDKQFDKLYEKYCK